MKTALVVEGGGMRGIFSAGVLDAFTEKRFDPFDLYLGVSSGACNLSSFVAGQHTRNYRIYTRQMRRPGFMSLARFVRGGHYMDLDWLWEAFGREDPLDVASASRNTREKEFVIVCTAVATGEPAYLIPTQETWLDCLKASSSIPLLYRGFTHIDSVPMTDGGVADPLPAAEACRRGAATIVVIRSRPAGRGKNNGMGSLLTSLAYRRYPNLRDAIRNIPRVYARSLEFISNPPDGIQVTQLAPPEIMKTGRTTQDLACLQFDYKLGLAAGRDFIARFNSG
jgi:predicted patatin/cPLA2 family phospholipase